MSHDNVFIAAARKHTTQFFVGNIHESSTYSGIATFLNEYDFHPTQIRLFKTRSGNLAAKINIPDSEADYVHEVNWPKGIIVKKWLSKRELRERYESRIKSKYNSNLSRYDTGHSEYDEYDEYDTNNQTDMENEEYEASRYSWGQQKNDDWWDYDTTY